MNPAPGSRYLSGKYISGHPDINDPVDNSSIVFTAKGLAIQNRAKSSIGLIPPDQIKDVSVEDASTIQTRVTATRLLTLGVLAFAAKKKQVSNEFYVTISWNDGRFDHETIFEFTGKEANTQANTLRNGLISICRQSPEDRQAAFDKIEADRLAVAAKKQADAEARAAMRANQPAPVKKAGAPMWLLVTGGLFVLLIIGVILIISNAPSVKSSSAATTSVSSVPTYKILSEHHNDVLKKCDLAIEIKDTVSEEQLRRIAYELHKDRTKYQRTYIGIYLPGMKVNAGSWATATYLPNLEVKIIGTKLATGSESISKAEEKVIGKWTWESSDADMYILIERDGKPYMKTIWKDGKGEQVDELVKSGSRYDYKKKDPIGVYYIVKNDGSLGFYNKTGEEFATGTPK